MREIPNLFLAGAVVGLIAASLAASDQADQIKLDERYYGPHRLFSLQPPADTQRWSGYSPGMLARWSYVHPKLKAVVWVLSIHHAGVTRKKQADGADVPFSLADYAVALKSKLTEEKKVLVKSVDVFIAADKPAIDIQGISLGKLKQWQRQVWILIQPDQFLIVKIDGPQDMKAELLAISKKVLGTLKINDPGKIRAATFANLKRGEALLAALAAGKADKQPADVIQTDTQWFMLKLKGKNVGYKLQTESVANLDDIAGSRIRAWVWFKPPGAGQPRLLKRVLFSTTKPLLERWTSQLQVGIGAKSVVVAESGITRNGEEIVCAVRRDTKKYSNRKMAPKKSYLPRAIGELLPRLVDLSKPRTCSFAAYETDANAIFERSFTVHGRRKITLGGKTVETTEATYRSIKEKQVISVKLWLDEKGLILRMETGQGLVMERSTREAVVKAFPRAAGVVKATASWAEQD